MRGCLASGSLSFCSYTMGWLKQLLGVKDTQENQRISPSRVFGELLVTSGDPPSTQPCKLRDPALGQPHVPPAELPRVLGDSRGLEVTLLKWFWRQDCEGGAVGPSGSQSRPQPYPGPGWTAGFPPRPRREKLGAGEGQAGLPSQDSLQPRSPPRLSSRRGERNAAIFPAHGPRAERETNPRGLQLPPVRVSPRAPILVGQDLG